MQLTGLSDLAAAIVEFAASDSSIFVKGEEEHARTNDFRDTETVTSELQNAIGEGVVEYDGGTFETANVEAALQELLSLQAQGVPLGVCSRARFGCSRLWRIVPPGAEGVTAQRAAGVTIAAALRRRGSLDPKPSKEERRDVVYVATSYIYVI